MKNREPVAVEGVWATRIGNCYIRVWINIGTEVRCLNSDELRELEDLERELKGLEAVTVGYALQRFCEEIDNLAAIEAKDGTGNGLVVYMEWP